MVVAITSIGYFERMRFKQSHQGGVHGCMQFLEEGQLPVVKHLLGQHLQLFGIKVAVSDLQQLLSQIP
jgi:hypothetical protein